MADTAEPEGQAAPAVQAVAEVEKFATYLCRCAPVLLEDQVDASPGLKVALADKQHTEQIRKFLSDPQSPALLIQRSSTKGVFMVAFNMAYGYIHFQLSVMTHPE